MKVVLVSRLDAAACHDDCASSQDTQCSMSYTHLHGRACEVSHSPRQLQGLHPPASISGDCHPGELGLPLFASCRPSMIMRDRLKSHTWSAHGNNHRCHEQVVGAGARLLQEQPSSNLHQITIQHHKTGDSRLGSSRHHSPWLARACQSPAVGCSWSGHDGPRHAAKGHNQHMNKVQVRAWAGWLPSQKGCTVQAGVTTLHWLTLPMALLGCGSCNLHMRHKPRA